MIDELVSKEHIDAVVKRLLTRSRQIQAHQQNERKLEYTPYCTMRKKHNVTGLMLSAFAPNQFECEGIQVTDVHYELRRQLVQPELYVDNAIIQIYSNGSDLKGKVISEHCEKYNHSDQSRPQFLLMVVTMNNDGVISGIELRGPDKFTKIVETLSVFTNVVQIASAM